MLSYKTLLSTSFHIIVHNKRERFADFSLTICYYSATLKVSLLCAEERGNAQKQMFGYLLGPYVKSQASVYSEVPLPPAFLNQSIWATSLIKVRGSLQFFQKNQLPSVGSPYNTQFS